MNMDVFEAWFEAAYPEDSFDYPLIRRPIKDAARKAWIASSCCDRPPLIKTCPLDTDENIGS